MFGIGHTELFIVLAICVLLFGARRIPELGKGLGKGIRSFGDAIKGIDTETANVTAVASEHADDATS